MTAGTHNIARIFESAGDSRHRFVLDRPLDIAPAAGTILTPAALSNLVADMAARLAAAGAVKGDRVAIVKDNHLDFIVLAAAAARLGCLPALMSAAVPTDRLRTMLERFSPDVLLASGPVMDGQAIPDRGPRLRVRIDGDGGGPADGSVLLAELSGSPDPPMRLVPDDEPMMCTHTSGTTGVPKLVAHSARTGSQWHSRLESFRFAPWSPGRSDVCASATGFMHIRNVAWLKGQLACRPRETVVISKPSLDHARQILMSHRPTILEAFPNTFQHWEAGAAAAPHPFELVRMFITTFDAVHPRTVETFLRLSRRRMPVWGHGWAQSETGPIGYSLHTRRSVVRHSDGRLQQFRFVAPGVRTRIVAVAGGQELPPGHSGLLELRTKGLCLDYIGEPGRHAHKLRDGWWNTGDIAVKHADRSLELLDREVDVLPDESTIGLESKLLGRLPSASEVVVLAQRTGLPLPVVATDRPESILAAWPSASAGLPAMQSPQLVRWDDIPRTATMKVRRADLRKQVADTSEGIGTGAWT